MTEIEEEIKQIKLYLAKNFKEINSDLFTRKEVDIVVLVKTCKEVYFYFQSEDTAGIIGHLLKWKHCKAPSPDLQCLTSGKELFLSIRTLMRVFTEVRIIK